MIDLDLLEALFDQHAGSPFFVKDVELRYVAANRAMAKLCGLGSSRDLVGLRARDLFSAPLANHYEALDRAVLLSGRPLTNVLEPTAGPDGAATWLLFARLPVRDAGGRVVGIAANAKRLRSGHASEACYLRVQEATNRMRLSFDRPVSLRLLALSIGTSITQLERDFARIFDMTPRAFLHLLRFDQARALLDDHSMSIAEIAHTCGYADHSAFSRRFLRETGATPSAYRRRSIALSDPEHR